MLGHLFDTVNRHKRRTKMFGYWMETVDRQMKTPGDSGNGHVSSSTTS